MSSVEAISGVDRPSNSWRTKAVRFSSDIAFSTRSIVTRASWRWRSSSGLGAVHRASSTTSSATSIRRPLVAATCVRRRTQRSFRLGLTVRTLLCGAQASRTSSRRPTDLVRRPSSTSADVKPSAVTGRSDLRQARRGRPPPAALSVTLRSESRGLSPRRPPSRLGCARHAPSV